MLLSLGIAMGKSVKPFSNSSTSGREARQFFLPASHPGPLFRHEHKQYPQFDEGLVPEYSHQPFFSYDSVQDNSRHVVPSILRVSPTKSTGSRPLLSASKLPATVYYEDSEAWQLATSIVQSYVQMKQRQQQIGLEISDPLIDNIFESLPTHSYDFNNG